MLDRQRLPIGFWTLAPAGAVLRGAMRLSVAGTELAVHINGALNNGWTKAELQEILIHSSAYCGWPAALEASRVAKEVLDQRAA